MCIYFSHYLLNTSKQAQSDDEINRKFLYISYEISRIVLNESKSLFPLTHHVISTGTISYTTKHKNVCTCPRLQLKVTLWFIESSLVKNKISYVDNNFGM